jgi:protoporphyrin/coproporphyrin ferrochelatase
VERSEKAEAMSSDLPSYDALLLLSFGGPEGPDDVMPFLENVVRGRNVPRERLLEVARHYELFDGVSPINGQNRALLAALVAELNANGPQLPVYWGNRNWHPMLEEAVGQMAEDGVRHALAFVTSPFGSYPGCRQYIEEIELARQTVGPAAPKIDKLRLFYNHPGFIQATADRVAAAWDEVPSERRDRTLLLFTAHSIPAAMAERSPYERQLREACQLVIEVLSPLLLGEGPGVRADEGSGFRVQGSESPNLLVSESRNSCGPHPNPLPKGEGTGIMFDLVFQSRSGPPSQPWLGPDIRDRIRQLPAEGIQDVVVVPIGFLAENMEVVYDLDVDVGELCDEVGVNMVRAGVVANHPRFVQMIRELVVERLDPTSPRLVLGTDGPWPDQCSADCCRSSL